MTDGGMTDGGMTDGGMTDGSTVVDARGRRCPLPIIDLARAIVTVAPGETVTLWANDPAAGPDVAAWCRLRNHELVSTGALPPDGEEFVVRRRS
ncbi:tRNA 2-thiouridine synthesizing protein A [Frankia sp. AiPs1]|uniref:sulfurtransferase TusA family protein n=1 Tax=Frankia sp. AiPa1 TaxID=573492 RepID=UPI00202B3E0F|nr:sulfurtransferase TusA family protein [Frankia sp. AiPa1]MCL9762378.1 sulfurtransferase TusA family protein [Frankia sp. AiPa1]